MMEGELARLGDMQKGICNWEKVEWGMGKVMSNWGREKKNENGREKKKWESCIKIGKWNWEDNTKLGTGEEERNGESGVKMGNGKQ